MGLRLTPYLTMDGNAAEAIRFYEQALGATVLGSQTFGDMPSDPEHPISPDVKERISHALLQVGESQLMLSDTFPGQPCELGNQISIAVSANTPERAREIFDALAEGGRVDMPMQETFFSPAYGQVTDKFGVKFQVVTDTDR